MGKTKTRLGMERTFAGWIRTGLVLVGIGAIAAEDLLDFEPEWLWWIIGILFLITGIIIFVYSFWEFYVNLRKLDFDNDEETKGMPVWLMGLVSALMLIGSTMILFIGLFG